MKVPADALIDVLAGVPGERKDPRRIHALFMDEEMVECLNNLEIHFAGHHAIGCATRIGDAAQLDMERIVSLKPDLVVAWFSGNKGDAVQQLHLKPLHTLKKKH